MTSLTDPRMTPYEALEAAATQPENIYYPFHILDMGGLRYKAANIYTSETVSGAVTWGEAKGLVLSLNDHTVHFRAYPILLKSRIPLAVYLIARRKAVQTEAFDISRVRDDDYLIARGKALMRKSVFDPLFAGLMEDYVQVVGEDLACWKDQEGPEVRMEDLQAGWTHLFREKVLAKKRAITETLRIVRAGKGIEGGLVSNLEEIYALLAELPEGK